MTEYTVMQPKMNVDQKIEQSLAWWIRASNQSFEKSMVTIRLEMIDDLDFWVSLRHDASSTLLTVSKGVVRRISQVLETYHSRLPKDCVLHHMVGFIVLHELAHIELGHFKFTDCFGIAQRSSPIRAHVTSTALEAPLCLEMQADHEATNALLGSYSADNWQELRKKFMAICDMMMLIEIADTKNGAEGQTHPKAATRVFQLLGHLAEMPLIQAQAEQDASLIPTEDELQAFARDVTIPCFFDAIKLAQAAGATSIASDLGNPEDFFKDLEIAKLGDRSRYAKFKTQGAQEWAKLWPCNEALKPILGSHFTT